MPDHPSSSHERTVDSGRGLLLFTLLVVIATVTVKLWLAWDVRASAMFSDDYAYLNKSIFYIHGQWDMPGYIFQNVFAGILYPLVISPWMLFDTPEARIFTIWVVNALLSGVTVWFGALAVGLDMRAHRGLAGDESARVTVLGFGIHAALRFE